MSRQRSMELNLLRARESIERSAEKLGDWHPEPLAWMKGLMESAVSWGGGALAWLGWVWPLGVFMLVSAMWMVATVVALILVSVATQGPLTLLGWVVGKAERYLSRGAWRWVAERLKDIQALLHWLENFVFVLIMFFLDFVVCAWMVRLLPRVVGRAIALRPSLAPRAGLSLALGVNGFALADVEKRIKKKGKPKLDRIKAMGYEELDNPDIVKLASLPIGLFFCMFKMNWPWKTPLDLIQSDLRLSPNATEDESQWISWAKALGERVDLAGCAEQKKSMPTSVRRL